MPRRAGFHTPQPRAHPVCIAKMTAMTTTTATTDVLDRLNLFDDPRVHRPESAPNSSVPTVNPATSETLAAVTLDSLDDYNTMVARAAEAQKQWRRVPAPLRGEIVRRIGLAMREQKDELGSLVTLEMGKIKPEGDGEVQECIDIADFAVGLSRQCYGLTMPSERPSHRMMEQWHPLGTVGVITAFNFPIAVWAWNSMLAAVCGNAVIWKPSLVTPLVAIAATNLANKVMREQDIFVPSNGVKPEDIFPLVLGTDDVVGQAMTADRRLPLISATGSCRMGRHVSQRVAGRLGRCLLELGGNNAMIIMPDADLELAARAALFGAVGTAGQRCTSTRRLLCVGGTADGIIERLKKAYATVNIGNPLDSSTLMGPLINEQSVTAMRKAIEQATDQGCEILAGGPDGIDRFESEPGHFVEPTIIRVPKGKVPEITKEETFAPILYIFDVLDYDEAIELHNGVDQGLSSAIFTKSGQFAERFYSPDGSDCGIANVNIGTSGAEIGGAFGGEKDTGGGRESGSDSWKAYMRRQTCTINYGNELPLAQGLQFG